MFVEQRVTECDFNQIKYDTPMDGAGIVARGATGRYCVVMYAGPEFLRKNNIVPLTHDEAVAEVEKTGDGWPEF